MSLTLTDVAPLTTWLFVRISPLEVKTMPVPMAVAPWRPRVEVTSTRPGSTRLAICDVVSIVFDVAVAFPVGVLPPWDSPMPAPAPTASATTAVAVSPSACRLRDRRGGSGTGYAPNGCCANGSLMVPDTPCSVRGSHLLYLEIRLRTWTVAEKTIRPSYRFPEDFLMIFRLTEVNAP